MRRNVPTLSTSMVFVFAFFSAIFAFGQSQESTTPHRFELKSPPPIVHGSASKETRKRLVINGSQSAGSQLPVWNYQVISPRDGNLYDGVIVGRNPSERGANEEVAVPAQVVPIILEFHRIGTSVNSTTGEVTTVSEAAHDGRLHFLKP